MLPFPNTFISVREEVTLSKIINYQLSIINYKSSSVTEYGAGMEPTHSLTARCQVSV